MMRRLPVVIILVTALLASCDPGAREAAPFEGIWESEGWGTFLLIEGGDVEIFESSALHCLSVASGGARGIADVLSLEDGRLLMRDSDREVRFDSIDLLPAACADAGGSSDPGLALGVLAATVEEQYIGELDPEWTERRLSLAATVEGMSDEALFEALVELVEPLNGRVRLADGGDRIWPQPPRLDPPPGVEAREGISSGTVGDSVGYLGLERIGPFAGDIDESEAILTDALDATLRFDGVILDLRKSDGGVLGHALLLATRFVPQEGVVARLEARAGEGYVSAGELPVTPLAVGTYPGNLAVLVGPETSGVGEVLAGILAGLPRVTLFGEQTAGSLGPPLIRFLPNGWSVAVPNLRVIDTGGSVVESIAPDVVTDDALGEARRALGG